MQYSSEPLEGAPTSRHSIVNFSVQKEEWDICRNMTIYI